MRNSIERACCHVCSYYPLYPPHPDVAVDVEYFDVHCRLPVAPHLMILPSDLRCFVKVRLTILLSLYLWIWERLEFSVVSPGDLCGFSLASEGPAQPVQKYSYSTVTYVQALGPVSQAL